MSRKNISGTHINYFFHCKRQLWYYSHNLDMEHTSDLVSIGKFIHNTTYIEKRKEIELENIKLDFFDTKNKILHEVKKSTSYEEAHKWQLLYYLFILKKKGVKCIKGELNYPKQKKIIEIILTNELEEKIKEIINEIEYIINLNLPPKIEISFNICKKCSYFELCYI